MTHDRVTTPHPPADGELELSIVMPCLNEAESLSSCIAKASSFLRTAGIRGETNLRTDPLYALGVITDQFQEDRTFFEGYYGRRLATRGAVTYRILSGFTYDRSLFAPLPQPGLTNVLPEDRTLSYPWIGFEMFHEGYIRAHDMDKMGRTEDFNLGRDLNIRFGFASPAFGADRSAAMVDLGWQSGFSPGQGQVLTLAASAAGRVTTTGVEDGLTTAALRYYHRDGDRFLFFAGLSGTMATRLDADHQVLLGGDNGLRGYPLRYALGDRAILLTVEERFYLQRELIHLFRLGAAVFAVTSVCADGLETFFTGLVRVVTGLPDVVEAGLSCAALAVEARTMMRAAGTANREGMLMCGLLGTLRGRLYSRRLQNSAAPPSPSVGGRVPTYQC